MTRFIPVKQTNWGQIFTSLCLKIKYLPLDHKGRRTEMINSILGQGHLLFRGKIMMFPEPDNLKQFATDPQLPKAFKGDIKKRMKVKK